MRIGVVGLGAMGGRIALKLLQAGHAVTVWNRSSQAARELVKAGASSAATVGDTLQGDIVLSVLFNDAAIRTVLLEPGGLVQAHAECVHVCMSTISLALAHELKDFHAGRGLRYVGAPLLGRPEVIEKQGLNILTGGDASILDYLETPLASLGRTWRMGPDPVHAQIAKLAANFLIGGALEAMAEAAALLQASGADAERFLSTMGETLFSSPIYRSYGPLISGRDPASLSGLSMPLKDIGHFLDAAKEASIRAPLAEAIRDNLTRAFESGGANQEWSTALARIARGGMEHPG